MIPSHFAIDGRRISRRAAPYLIAEAGVNHNGDPELAVRLVDAAAEAGADAIKFQTFTAESLATASAPQAAYQRTRAAAASQQAMLRTLELEPIALRAAFDHAKGRGITAFSTPFDIASVHLLADLGVPCFKIGSGDLTNLILLREVASIGRPVILSTGMATLDEVDAAVRAMRTGGDPPLAILHCLSSYPAPASQVHLRVIPRLRRRYGVEVGFSDHTLGDAIAIASIALGTTIVEKHLTLDRSLPGPDHAASAEPRELQELAVKLKDAYAALGRGKKEPQPSEADARIVARRSLVLVRDLPAGAIIAADDLEAKRPGDGISPLYLDSVVGRRLAHAVSRDRVLRMDDLSPH